MTSLYRRAIPFQAYILRAVEGAVKNACDAHPKYKLPKEFARSIAKRAAGTITSQWSDVLAAKPSVRQSNSPLASCLPSVILGGRKRGPSRSHRRSPFSQLHKRLSIDVGHAKLVGHAEKAEILIGVLRLIAAMEAE